MAGMDITPILLQLAARPCGTTTTHPEFAPNTPTQVGNLANRLILAGKLFRVKSGHRTMTLYANKADADRELAGLAQRQPTVQTAKAVRVSAAADAAIMFAPGFAGIQYGPNYVPRFQMQVLAGVYGGNQRGRVVMTGTEAEAPAI